MARAIEKGATRSIPIPGWTWPDTLPAAERLPEHLQAAYDDLLSFLKEGGQD